MHERNETELNSSVTKLEHNLFVSQMHLEDAVAFLF